MKKYSVLIASLLALAAVTACEKKPEVAPAAAPAAAAPAEAAPATAAPAADAAKPADAAKK